MPKARIKRIETPAQLRILSSPPTLEVLEAIQARGPSTIAELGPAIGRRPNTLHYHVRKLLRTKLIERVGSRRSGARTEAIYDAVARGFDGAHLMTDNRFRRASVDAVSSILRLATRNFSAALDAQVRIVASGKRRNLLARRTKARLTYAQLAEVNDLIERLDSLLSAGSASNKGTLHAVTIVLTPIKDASER